jgi:nitroimidazol reductase NimA-like FMN-containing flavoprotein (pyridoxamine 5'-phosphate oxidase superfamily)
MRRKDREVTEVNELLQIIDQCKVCRVAMQDQAGLYIVPLNFGYTFENDQLVLFFHSAKEGRKIDALTANSDVCFEMDCEHRLISADEACGYGYYFKSVIGNGRAVFVDNVTEKEHALSVLMKHQTGKDFIFDERMVEGVCVFKIIVHHFTGKDHR